MIAAARTHPGRVRTNNEDAFVCLPDRGLFAVIDGMGGEAAGEVAAAIAAQVIGGVSDAAGLASETLLSGAFKDARARILQEGEHNAAHRDMGAVATAVRLDDEGNMVGIAHVGDTRLWHVSAGGVRRLTVDHLDAVAGPSGKRAVARDLGRRDLEAPWVDTSRVPVATGDLLLLSTDGLYDVVPEEELGRELARFHKEGADPDTITQKLVAAALSRGAPDNVTVIAIRVGRFRRGAPPPRVRNPWPAIAGVLFLLLVGTLGGAGALLFWPEPAAALPTTVTETTRFFADAPIRVQPGHKLTVATGATLTIRGVRVDGEDLTIKVEKGATLVIELSSLQFSGPVTLLVEEDARLSLFDARLAADTLVFSGLGAVQLGHADIEGRGGFSPTLNVSWTKDELSRILPPPPPEAAPADTPSSSEPVPPGAPVPGAPTQGAASPLPQKTSPENPSPQKNSPQPPSSQPPSQPRPSKVEAPGPAARSPNGPG